MHTPHVVGKVFLSSEANQDGDLRALLRKHNIPAAMLKNPREASNMVGEDTAHQGVIAIADPSALMRDFNEFLTELRPDENTSLVLLDELTDPHNVGAIIRSAAAFGASAVLIPPHNQAPITGSVVKASAGMAFRIPVVSIGNVNQAILKLKDEGFKAYALAMEGAKDVTKVKFDAPSVFVIGNEGRGIREKTLEHSDVILKIPMDPRCESLNASVSAAVVLYQWSAQHPAALKHE
jgi:23S rRNA (guanosine2251-2'-O)-methyltransferase